MPAAPPLAKPPASPGAELVDRRVRQASRALVAGDLATAVATLLIGALVFLAVAALLEHWVTTSGLRRAERWGLWTVGLIGAVAYSLRKIAPLVVRRINPLYAASQIENEAPSLKNSLVNLLQLSGAPKPVRATLEQQAMQRLRDAGDTSLDRSRIVRLGYLLLAIFVGMGAYTVLSPKNLFVSAARIAAPWSDLSAPTRVSIADLTPGDAEVSQGDTVEVSARVLGLDNDEPVELVYTTADGRSRDARMTMRPDESGVRYRAQLPAGSSDAAVLGLQSGVRYRIEAGDARTEAYQLRVLASPTIAPIAVAYDYPDYTGYLDRTVDGGGDIQAIEGTRVTVTASANLPIESAQIDRGADGVPDVRMEAQEQNATGKWTLRIESDALRETSTYVIRFSTPDGLANTNPPVYRIETLADLNPEARIIAPEEEQKIVRMDQPVEFRVSARDPDFALTRVSLAGEVEGRSRVDVRLFETSRDVAPREGSAEFSLTRTPRELGLRPGEQLTYRFVVSDTRAPKPNTAASATQVLVVGGESEQRPGGSEPDAGTDGRPDPNGERQPEDQQQPGAGGAEGGEQQDREGQQPGGDPSQQQDQPSGQQPGQQQNEQSRSDSDGENGEQGADDSNGLKGPGGDGQSGESEQGGSPSQNNGEGERSPNGPPSQGGSPTDRNGDASNPNSNSNASPEGTDSQQGQEGSGEADPNGGGQQGGESGGEQPVARDGSDDGSAFDRIREHFEQQENGAGESDSQSDPSGDGQPGEGQSRDGQSQQDQPQGDGAQPSDTQPSGGPDQGTNERGGTEPSPERDTPSQGDGAGKRGEQRDSQTSDGGGEAESGRSTDPSAGPREGTGESGENQAADEGTGQSGDRGAGESSGQRGEQQRADEPTGQSSGDERGPGSRSRESDQGQTNGAGDRQPSDGRDQRGDSDQSVQPQDGQQSDGSDSDQQRGGEESDGNRSGESGQRSGEQPGDNGQQQGRDGGEPGDGSEGSPDGANEQAYGERTESGSPGDRGEQGGSEATDTSRESNLNGAADEPGDAANLDYARRQTELTLEKLGDQLARGEADRELLDKLGWTEDDLRRFVERWRQRRREAERSTEGAAELDTALRSLGLRPEGPRGAQNIVQDELRDLRQGPRTPPPPALLQRLRSYNRGVSSAPSE